MKKEELMVGDCVYLDSKVVRIQEIRSLGIVTTDKQTAPYANIRPIPISVLILKNNKFIVLAEESNTRFYRLSSDKMSFIYAWCNTKTKECIITEVKGFSPTQAILINTDITHVHELQHALKLCNINMEIIL